MKNACRTVTVYRKRWDPDLDADVYEGTVIPDVSFFSRISTAVSTEGLQAACEGILRIPLESMPEELELRNGDLICEGELETEGMRPSDLDGLCPYVFTVAGITRNTSGRGAHIKVVCK